MSDSFFETKSFFAVAIDPIHVGSGGERIGRVDLTVVREPVTDLPKIPGTSISGALKSYLDLQLRTSGKKNVVCASTEGSKHDHKREECPVCTLFGFAEQGKDKGAAAQGILCFSDATLLAYPVNTLCGPVWITTAPRLKDLCDIGDGVDFTEDKFCLGSDTGIKSPLQSKLNFGWVLLEKSEKDFIDLAEELEKAGLDKKFAERFAVVPEWIFIHMVNSNMEVRTSVVIDPKTGAASGKGLFTYEAVARGAIFKFDVTAFDYSDKWKAMNRGDAIEFVQDNAFPGIEAVGLGGMTSRGFGRMKFTEIKK